MEPQGHGRIGCDDLFRIAAPLLEVQPAYIHIHEKLGAHARPVQNKVLGIGLKRFGHGDAADFLCLAE